MKVLFRSLAILWLVISFSGIVKASLNLNARISSSEKIIQRLPAFYILEKQNIPEFGMVTAVEDAGYPFAMVTVLFPERNFEEYFSINMEEVENASLETMNNYIGKYIHFTYSTEINYVLLDLFFGNSSVFGAEVAPEGDEVKSIEGILYGAEKETQGDLPGTVSVFADDGENLYFEFFITNHLVNVNEKRVKAFYMENKKNTILTIRPAND